MVEKMLKLAHYVIGKNLEECYKEYVVLKHWKHVYKT